jgi:aminoglycoside/choline kinase family phosphotransferase
VHQTQGTAAVEQLWRVSAVQRLIHCVACYVWVNDHVGNPAYLSYLPFAVDALQHAVDGCAAAAPLAAVLDKRWPAMTRRWCFDGVPCLD